MTYIVLIPDGQGDNLHVGPFRSEALADAYLERLPQAALDEGATSVELMDKTDALARARDIFADDDSDEEY